MLLRRIKAFPGLKVATIRAMTTESPPDRVKKAIEESKENLKWRTPYNDRDGEWYSKFKLFSESKEENSDLISLLQQPINISPSAIKKWMERRAEKKERFMQQFIPERLEILGADLAAAHFIVHRGGSVKFLNNPTWVKADGNNEYELPKKFDASFQLEAIRCDNMLLYYEGLENLRRLQELKFLSFHNIPTFDDWSLDRISGSEFEKLEVLDISATNVTSRGLSCVYRLGTLRLLIVDDPQKDKEFELASALLENFLPNLKICPADRIHDNKLDSE